jgi:hypothetical protein
MKALVRTDVAPTNTNSPPKSQTTQTPPNPKPLPSRRYPPNTLYPATHGPLFTSSFSTTYPIVPPSFVSATRHTCHPTPTLCTPVLELLSHYPPSPQSTKNRHPEHIRQGYEGPQHQSNPKPVHRALRYFSSLRSLRCDLSVLCAKSPRSSPKTKTAQPKLCRPRASCYPIAVICSPLPLNSYSNVSTHPPSAPQSSARRHSSSPISSSN